ncbi:hypothetical protein CJO92_23560 (plasmid) [Ralstonia solanacearum]|uniref:Uncharacterized protein n=1 Tax=Ralstonia solanacearum TaxID=305 RepID=A0AAD0SDP0_RALSL|nr:hypothetical protein CJO77_23545 [Ralstonia solanacearum]AXW55589.1 hypothetical protein CJO92_23560 [Ralstonia solanacearum]
MPINEFRAIATFAKAVELGSIRQAALAQGVTPQAAKRNGAGSGSAPSPIAPLSIYNVDRYLEAGRASAVCCVHPSWRRLRAGHHAR